MLLAVTVLQHAICCSICQKSENYGYEWLEKLCRIVLDEFMFQSSPQERYSYQVCNIVYECDPSDIKLYDSDFWALSQNCEKQLLALSCLSVRVSAWYISAPTGRIFMKFDYCVFLKICQENSSVIKL